MPRADLPRADRGPLTARAFISGCAGRRLTDDERALFGETEPWGLILFKRNCHTKDQIRDLVTDFREIVGRDDAPVDRKSVV